MPRTLRRIALASVAVLTVGACGGSDDDAATDGRPTVVVTTNILGDVVSRTVGDLAEVVTIMPVGADPHDFQPSAQEIDQMTSADALIVNGAGFEEGLVDVIESAESDGVATFDAISAVEAIDFGEDGHDEHDDEEEHDDDEHDGDGDHEGVDPHFFTDPTRMADAVEGIVDFLVAEVDGIDADALGVSAADYVDALSAVDAEVAALVDGLDEASRVLVTNHEVFGYFADRYGFEVVGTVVPGGSTTDAASAGELAELASTIEREGVRAIFTDTSSSDELVDALADEVGDIAIVELFTESLGESGSDGATYLDMIRSNAERITTALA